MSFNVFSSNISSPKFNSPTGVARNRRMLVLLFGELTVCKLNFSELTFSEMPFGEMACGRWTFSEMAFSETPGKQNSPLIHGLHDMERCDDIKASRLSNWSVFPVECVKLS